MRPPRANVLLRETQRSAAHQMNERSESKNSTAGPILLLRHAFLTAIETIYLPAVGLRYIELDQQIEDCEPMVLAYGS